MAETSAPSTHGCMECKRQQPYTVEPFDNGNTGWRCMVCGKILRLIPGHYGDATLDASAHEGGS
jgi:hypothetical protein